MVERPLLEHQREASAAKNAFADELERRRLLREGWSQEDIDAERRFGKRCARLYPYVGREGAVRTPLGQGTLLQAIADSPGRGGGAMVLPLRPRAFFWEDGKKKAAAVFVSIESVRPFLKGEA